MNVTAAHCPEHRQAAVQQEMVVTVVMCTSCRPGVHPLTAALINIDTLRSACTLRASQLLFSVTVRWICLVFDCLDKTATPENTCKQTEDMQTKETSSSIWRWKAAKTETQPNRETLQVAQMAAEAVSRGQSNVMHAAGRARCCCRGLWLMKLLKLALCTWCWKISYNVSFAGGTSVSQLRASLFSVPWKQCLLWSVPPVAVFLLVRLEVFVFCWVAVCWAVGATVGLWHFTLWNQFIKRHVETSRTTNTTLNWKRSAGQWSPALCHGILCHLDNHTDWSDWMTA